MEHLPSDTSDTRPPTETRVVTALVLAAGLALGAGSVAAGAWDGEQAPFPYIWRDVAMVHFLCALPLAWVLAAFIIRRASAAGSAVLVILLLGVRVFPLMSAARESILTVLLAYPLLGVVIRAAPALGLTLSAALASAVLIGGRRAEGHRGGWGHAAAIGALGTVVLLLPPAIYVRARCQHDLTRLGQFLEQSRFGEARTLVHGLLALDADKEWNGHPLPKVAANIDRIVRALESHVAVPLAVDATPGARLDRARQLAMLGRTEAALEVLPSVTEPALAPEVDTLRGTIYETRGEWRTALSWYESAEAAWESRPPSPARAEGLLRATTGIAYCQRKLGHYAEAEATYQQVLALSPTAESHFLLAQFYEDTQQAEKARAHARRAIELAPHRYRREGEKLIRKLTVYHFGCLGVFTAENERSNASLAPGGGIDEP